MIKIIQRALLVTLCICAVATSLAHANTTTRWYFQYFAGDPPTWKNHPEEFPNKASCEIARAERSTVGYPVKECMVRQDPASTVTTTTITTVTTPTLTAPDTTVAPTTPASKTSDAAKRIEEERQKKLKEGCYVGCTTDRDTCLLEVSDMKNCIQNENSRCIERCTSVEQLPHHQCINEICLPDELNLAAWKGYCESAEEQSKDACASTYKTCRASCDATP